MLAWCSSLRLALMFLRKIDGKIQISSGVLRSHFISICTIFLLFVCSCFYTPPPLPLSRLVPYNVHFSDFAKSIFCRIVNLSLLFFMLIKETTHYIHSVVFMNMNALIKIDLFCFPFWKPLSLFSSNVPTISVVYIQLTNSGHPKNPKMCEEKCAEQIEFDNHRPIKWLTNNCNKNHYTKICSGICSTYETFWQV